MWAAQNSIFPKISKFFPENLNISSRLKICFSLQNTETKWYENNDLWQYQLIVYRFVILVWHVLQIQIMIIQVFLPNMWLHDGTVHQKSCWIPRYGFKSFFFLKKVLLKMNILDLWTISKINVRMFFVLILMPHKMYYML